MSNEKEKEKQINEAAEKGEEKMKQLYLIELESKGIRIASIASILLAIVLFVLEIILQGKQNFGMYALVGCFCTVSFCYYGFRTKSTPYSLTGLIWGALTVFFIVLYILDMVDHGGAL
ncbi:MAG: hypothetical protein J5757_06425 [Lachnospiraceae bacterium]|nr:hypothetical protein [Lachnospiraceae bacterium]